MLNNSTYSHTEQKMKFSITDFFNKSDYIPQFLADLVTLTEKILNGKLRFFCSATDLKHLRASCKYIIGIEYFQEFLELTRFQLLNDSTKLS